MTTLMTFAELFRKWITFENSIYQWVPYLLAVIVLGTIIHAIETRVKRKKSNEQKRRAQDNSGQ